MGSPALPDPDRARIFEETAGPPHLGPKDRGCFFAARRCGLDYRGNVRSWVAFALAAGIGAFPRVALGEEATSALSWVRLPGAESCIATPELGARVEQRLGRPALVAPSVATISIEGHVERTADKKFRATVGGTRRDGTTIGSREIVSQDTDCRSLDEGLVLVIALMIDPDALAPARPKEEVAPAPPPPVTREVVHERVVVHEIDHLPATSTPWVVQGSVEALVAVARLPATSPGAMLAFRAGPTPLVAFEASVGALPSATLEVAPRSIDYVLVEGGLAYCPAVRATTRIEVGACAGLRAGSVHSQGRGFTSDRATDRGFADVALGGRFTALLAGPVFVLARATALVPLVRRETTAGGTTLDRQSALGGEFGLGIGLRFSP